MNLAKMKFKTTPVAHAAWPIFRSPHHDALESLLPFATVVGGILHPALFLDAPNSVHTCPRAPTSLPTACHGKSSQDVHAPPSLPFLLFGTRPPRSEAHDLFQAAELEASPVLYLVSVLFQQDFFQWR